MSFDSKLSHGVLIAVYLLIERSMYVVHPTVPLSLSSPSVAKLVIVNIHPWSIK
jgi:hypothetical protein